jgi:hypothetical protein
MRFFIGAVLTAGLSVFGNISAMAESSVPQIENIGDVATELGNLVNYPPLKRQAWGRNPIPCLVDPTQRESVSFRATLEANT